MVAERVRRECAAGYDEGTLRAYLDGELESAASGALQAHARDCAACSEELMRLRLDGALVQGRLALLDAGVPGAAGRRPPVAAVLAAAQRREQAGWHAALLGAAARLQEAMAPPWRPAPLAGGLAAGAALLVGVAFTQPAVQSFAQGVAQSLRVQKVQPVTLD